MAKTCTLDIETSCLLADALDYSQFPYKLKSDVKIWCVVITDIQTLESFKFIGDDITYDNLDNVLKNYNTIVAHRGHKFDLIKLQLFGLITYKVGYIGQKDILNGREVRLIDTEIMSRLINPDRLGGHSLDSWGKRVGSYKTDYRGELIKLGEMPSSSPKGFEFSFFHPLMVDYCVQDTIVNVYTYYELLKEYQGYSGWKLPLQQEHKLADLAIRRETLGFWFDKELAIKNLEELTIIMDDIQKRVNPILPKKPFTKKELSDYTPPKNQLKKDGTWSNHMLAFFERLDITEYSSENKLFIFENEVYNIPHYEPLRIEREATVDDLDVVKEYLLELGWQPTEWKERDLTKDSKKQTISLDKRVKALERYCEETLKGKYKEGRLAFLKCKEDKLYSTLRKDLGGSKPVKVLTSPSIRVGIAKELCPNLIELGEKVSFAKDVADYYTYRHRKSCIAGGDIDDMDFDDEVPNTGYLSNYREQDGRISTPAIEIGASTNRYKHIGVANVPRLSSLYGENMRALFGAGKDFVQFGFDYASLEARIEGNYVFDYEGGEELSIQLLAEKPNDIHTVTANKLEIDRDSAKSTNYAMLYGASPSKFVKMLGYTLDRAKKFHEDWWNANPSLKQLKEDKDKEWLASGKKYIISIDGRRINIRSQHSILNALFQSAGVICAKYITVMMFQKFEQLGWCIDVFKGKPDVAPMIEYHDENQLAVNKELLKFKVFKNKEEAEEFKNNWSGEQLGAIQKSKLDKYYITLPNEISKTITESIRNVEEMFKMKVPLGYEYVTGRNWADCH